MRSNPSGLTALSDKNKPENYQNWNFRNPTKVTEPAFKYSEVAKNGAENL